MKRFLLQLFFHISIALLGNSAYSQSKGELVESGRRFFAELGARGTQFHIAVDRRDASGQTLKKSGSIHIGPLGDRRIVMRYEFPRRTKDFTILADVIEVLALRDGTWICGLAAESHASDKEPSDGVTTTTSLVTGGFDWPADGLSIDPSIHLLAGLCFDGSSFVDLLDEGFWDVDAFDQSEASLTIGRELPSGAFLQMAFVLSETGSPTLARVTSDVTAQRLESNYSRLIIDCADVGSAGWQGDVAYRARVDYPARFSPTSMTLTVHLARREPEPNHHDAFDNFAFIPCIDADKPIRVSAEPLSQFFFRDGKLIKSFDKSSLRQIERLLHEHSDASAARVMLPDRFTAMINGRPVDCILSPDLSSHNARPFCGLYALAAASAKHGVDLDLVKVLAGSIDFGSRGISGQDLVSLARKAGLHPFVISGGMRQLRSSHLPAILHFQSQRSHDLDHWVALTHFDEVGNAKIYDLPLAASTTLEGKRSAKPAIRRLGALP